jgi:peroxiredoxin
MAQLRRDISKFEALNTEIVVIGPDTAEAFSLFWKKYKLPFIGLPDPTYIVLKLYGQELNLFKLGRMPAQVIIDQQGIARFAHYGHAMNDIPANEEVLHILKILTEKVLQ